MKESVPEDVKPEDPLVEIEEALHERVSKFGLDMPSFLIEIKMKEERMKEKSLGQIAFEAYKTRVDGLTYDGKPIADWEGLSSDTIREAWEAGAVAVAALFAPQEKDEGCCGGNCQCH